MGELTESHTPPLSHPRSFPAREDCWCEEATFTLIEAWGQRYLELNRGNLRRNHWQEVAGSVNARHGDIKKARRTDVQCKNRIDTLKKKYKIEKARVLDSNGSFKSDWPFFAPLDALIGSTTTTALMKSSPQMPSTSPPMAVPLFPYGRTPPAIATATVVPQKRPSPTLAPRPADKSYFRKNYSAVAAAAAAASASASAAETDDDEDEEEYLDESKSSGDASEADGIRKLARTIERFGEVYARVEAEKQRQMIELEMQRMQFAKELECQRVQMLVDLQVQLEKTKRAKGSNSTGETKL